MRVAINLVKDGTAQACISAGNTGALMAISRFVLKTLPGIDRPAIASQLPTRTGSTTALDLGANVNCTPEQLVQFAVMGSALVSAIDGVDRPTVGLLNIGEEDIKGNDVVKQAGELLKTSGLNFYGNVEGDDLYKGTTQVVVCDGFVGNVALKTSEGLAKMLADFLREEFTRNAFRKTLAVFALPILNSFRRRVDPRRYNGATLIGLKGHRGEEPWRRRRAGVPLRAEEGLCRSRARRARAHQPAPRRYAGASACRCRYPCPRRATERAWSMYSRIAGTGGYLPAKILTNVELATRIDTSDEWVRARTGIRERRIAADERADERSRVGGGTRRL